MYCLGIATELHRKDMQRLRLSSIAKKSEDAPRQRNHTPRAPASRHAGSTQKVVNRRQEFGDRPTREHNFETRRRLPPAVPHAFKTDSLCKTTTFRLTKTSHHATNFTFHAIPHDNSSLFTSSHYNHHPSTQTSCHPTNQTSNHPIGQAPPRKNPSPLLSGIQRLANPILRLGACLGCRQYWFVPARMAIRLAEQSSKLLKLT